MGHDSTGHVVDSLEQSYVIIRKLPEFENEPYPSMDNRRKGRLKIVSSEDGDVAGVLVTAFGLKIHGKNSAGRIKVKDIVQEISTSYETILCFMCDKLILWLERFDVGRHNKLIVRIL